jgi:hypothetical protein
MIVYKSHYQVTCVALESKLHSKYIPLHETTVIEGCRLFSKFHGNFCKISIRHEEFRYFYYYFDVLRSDYDPNPIHDNIKYS